MAQLSPAVMLVPAEPVQRLPGVDVRAQYTTDDSHTFLRLKRVVIECHDWSDDTAITAAVLHAIRLSALRLSGEQILGMRRDYTATSAPISGRQPGRPRDTWTDREFARLAARYSELVQNPLTVGALFLVLEREWRTPKGERVGEAALRSAVQAARKMGLLTATKPGRAGGTLTAKARALLD